MNNYKVFVIDVDGVMTDGFFFYSEEGKVLKRFGADDNDALSLLSQHMEIQFVTGDRKGFKISERRIVHDMKYPLELVSTVKRAEWIAERWPLDSVIYMGDGIFDYKVFEKIGYSISVPNGDAHTRAMAKYVTTRNGGDRAVSEACLHIMGDLLKISDPYSMKSEELRLSGEWGL